MQLLCSQTKSQLAVPGTDHVEKAAQFTRENKVAVHLAALLLFYFALVFFFLL